MARLNWERAKKARGLSDFNEDRARSRIRTMRSRDLLEMTRNGAPAWRCLAAEELARRGHYTDDSMVANYAEAVG